MGRDYNKSQPAGKGMAIKATLHHVAGKKLKNAKNPDVIYIFTLLASFRLQASMAKLTAVLKKPTTEC